MSEEELNEAMQYNLDYTEAMLNDELFGTNEVAEVKLLASEKAIKDLQQKVEQLEKRNKEIYDGFKAITDELCETTERVEQLENIRKEAMEYIERDKLNIDESQCYVETQTGWKMIPKIYDDLLNILNKGSE